MKNPCQRWTETQINDVLKLLQEFIELFNRTLGTWKIEQLDFELKDNVKPISPRPYSVTKVHEEMLKKRLTI